MGKQIISQKRGRGSPTYRVSAKNFRFHLLYRTSGGSVKDIVDDPGRTCPVALVKYDDGATGYIPACEGLSVKDRVENYIMPLSRIPESKPIFAIESFPNSGPMFCRAGGSFAIIVSKEKNSCVIQFPSKKTKTLDPNCRAMLGVPAGAGRLEKPWVRAGTKWIAMRRRGRLYPRSSPCKMNAVNHPFGGAYSGVNKCKTVSRNAPPGRKVGSIAASRTGRRKK